MPRKDWLAPGAWMLALGAALSLACLVALLRFGFMWVLAWWLALSVSAAWSGWRWWRQEIQTAQPKKD
jgi:membrane protein implicated in regulation of membrane protease activity